MLLLFLSVCLPIIGGHENKIMACDIATPGDGSEAHYIATASYDRTWKLWGPDLLADL